MAAVLGISRDLSVTIDDGDADDLSRHKWVAIPKGRGGGFYAGRTAGRTTIYMHRQILDARSGQIVDHINGNGLDNRRSNLRFVTAGQNAANSAPGGASGYRGVEKHYGRKKPWRARIVKDGRPRYLGIFETAEAAARAYDAAAKEHYGEFARLNFPDQNKGAA